MNLKLYCVVMMGMKNVLQSYIHEDQSGFLPKRQLRDNVTTVFNIIEYLTIL